MAVLLPLYCSYFDQREFPLYRTQRFQGRDLFVQVIIRWHEAGIRVRASIALPAATDEDALPSMLTTLFQSFAAMQVMLVLASSLFL